MTTYLESHYAEAIIGPHQGDDRAYAQWHQVEAIITTPNDSAYFSGQVVEAIVGATPSDPLDADSGAIEHQSVEVILSNEDVPVEVLRHGVEALISSYGGPDNGAWVTHHAVELVTKIVSFTFVEHHWVDVIVANTEATALDTNSAAVSHQSVEAIFKQGRPVRFYAPDKPLPRWIPGVSIRNP